MRDMRYEIRKYLAGLVWLVPLEMFVKARRRVAGVLFLTGLVLVVFSSNGYGLAARQVHVELAKAGPTEPNVVEVQETDSNQPDIIEQACELIYRGQFDAAGELIESVPSQYDTSHHRLLKIVREYEAMSQRRQAEREAAYRRQLAELEKFQVAADSNDVNNVEDVTRVLSVIARASEFADEAQKEELLSDSFVKRTFQETKDRAAEFESKGKWLDAYVKCYSWLQTILPEDKEYSDYAEQLAEKANIVASFQDSPCESCQERYEKVEKQMFVRAIDALNFNYVSIIDYRQMTTKAIRRCKLLGEVMEFSIGDFTAAGESVEDQGSEAENRIRQRRAAWSVGLAAIQDEVGQSAPGFGKSKFIDTYEKVLALNATTVELPHTALIAQFAEAALSALDRYTVMVWPRQVQDFEKTMTNEFTGIGIEITKQKGLLTVASLLPDTPAYKAGLDAGDVIEEVDRVQTKDMSLGCAVRKITGPGGTEVMLTIRRPGEDKTRDIAITRAKIIVPTIRGLQRTKEGKWLHMIDDESKIGYVRITSFSATTASDLDKVLSELEWGPILQKDGKMRTQAEGLNGLILDLRFNSGGLLPSAVEVADRFLTKGLIVRTQPRWGVPTYAPAHKENTHPNYPLIILVNRYSASASEIVSGALQDEAHKRAILVGERTVGKGLVQGITSYPGGGAQLKYTMAYYHLPSGQRVESEDSMKKQGRKDWGIGPNIKIELRSDELKKMVDVQRDNDVLVQADHHNGSVPLKRHTPEEILASDPQLAVGLLVAESKLIQKEVRSSKEKTAEL